MEEEDKSKPEKENEKEKDHSQNVVVLNPEYEETQNEPTKQKEPIKEPGKYEKVRLSDFSP